MRTPEKKKGPTRWNNAFKIKWTEEHPCMKASRKGENHAFCEVCRTDFSISHGGLNDVTHHVNTEKHKSNAKAMRNTMKMTFQPQKQRNTIINAEVLFQGFLTRAQSARNLERSIIIPRLAKKCIRSVESHVSIHVEEQRQHTL